MQCPAACKLCRFLPLLKEALACEDSHENCALWARQGECRKNPHYMENSCATSCAICDKKRAMCDRPPDTPPLVTPGVINETMLRIMQFKQYSPKALSFPGGPKGPKAPWVISLSNCIVTAVEPLTC